MADARRALAEHHAAGGVLTASAGVPDGSKVRQTIGVHRTSTGGARVHVETYEPTEWDTELETFERLFPDLDAALTWLEADRGVSWTQLKLQPRRQG